MKEIRCGKCNKLILKYELKGKLQGALEIEFKCSRCDKVTKLQIKE